jgi:hypothetical protein
VGQEVSLCLMSVHLSRYGTTLSDQPVPSKSLPDG